MCEVSLEEVIGAIGVYVIWDDRDAAFPRYIGKGVLSDRLESHRKKSEFRPPFVGYVAVVGSSFAANANQLDAQAEMLEGMLLWVAEQTHRLSPVNKKGSGYKKLWDQLDHHGKVRAKLDGFDPFSDPRMPRPLAVSKRFISVFESQSELKIDHNWKKLRSDARRGNMLSRLADLGRTKISFS